MAKLNAPMQLAIVQALACYDTPSAIVDQVKKEFGVALTRQQVAKYDPTKVAGEKVSPKLRAVFDATRKAFLTDVASIPISHMAYRLRMLQRQLEKAEERGNTAMVMQLLEQAAKESGGAFTNKTKLEHSGEIRHPELKLVLNMADGSQRLLGAAQEMADRYGTPCH